MPPPLRRQGHNNGLLLHVFRLLCIHKHFVKLSLKFYLFAISNSFFIFLQLNIIIVISLYL